MTSKGGSPELGKFGRLKMELAGKGIRRYAGGYGGGCLLVGAGEWEKTIHLVRPSWAWGENPTRGGEDSDFRESIGTAKDKDVGNKEVLVMKHVETKRQSWEQRAHHQSWLMQRRTAQKREGRKAIKQQKGVIIF